MAELHRVLAVGGGTFLQVRLRGAVTYEDYAITDSAERTKHLGQSDHVRFYGEDFKDRLEDAGFQVEAMWMPDELGLTDKEIQRMNLAKRELCHYCRKQSWDGRSAIVMGSRPPTASTHSDVSHCGRPT
jgi:hypothetical protein